MSLKNGIEHEFDAPIRLRMGAPGALDVYVDGKQIYSKRKSGRLPTSEELIHLIRTKVAQGKQPQ